MAYQIRHDQAVACHANPPRQHLSQCFRCKVMQKERRDHEIDAAFSKGRGKYIALDKYDFSPSPQVPSRPLQMGMAKV